MGKLTVVGIGPGDKENMTRLALSTLESADIIAGYSGYINLLKHMLPDKDFLETGMTLEAERCRAAIDLAKEGKNVAVVSGGDAGVYGMASLILELSGDSPGLEVTTVPGVTAAVSGAALLGAPIANDFAVISLSDLLTPWPVIEKRLKAAADGDFAICLYNPGSHKRTMHLQNACDILLTVLPKDRICGVARSIAREGQEISLLTLGELRETKGEMTDTVFVGNSVTRIIAGRMVTPRGYING